MTAFLKILVLCFLLLMLMSCQQVARWRGPCSIWPMPPPEGGTPLTRNFSSAEGRFRIGLPARQEKPGTDANNDNKTFKWLVFDQGEFQVFYLDRDRAVDTPDLSQTILNNIRNNASSRGKVTADSEISVSGHPGREFRLETDGGTQIERVYLAGNRVYVVTVFVPKDWSCKVDSAVKVLDTFEITQ